MLKKRLLWRLYPSYLLITIIAIIVVAWFSSHSFRNFYLTQTTENLKSRAFLVKDQISTDLANHNFSAIDSFCKKAGPASSTRITVILVDGKVIADSEEEAQRMKNHADRPEFAEAIEKGMGSSIRASETIGKKMMYLAIPLKNEGQIIAIVRASMPINNIDEEFKNIYHKILWAVLIIAVIAAIVTLELSRKISCPIEKMKETAELFASGDLNLRLPIPDETELAELARALNEMARQLNERINTITRQRNELEAILSSMVEGVVAVDPSGHVVSINKAAANFLNIKTTEAYGRNIEEIVRDTELQEFIQKTINSEDPTETDVFLTGAADRFFGLHGARLTDDEGLASGAVIVFNDLTRLQKLENVRRDFVANVSHELKTPITSIKGFVETLLDGAVNDTEQAKRFLNIIAKHSDRLNAIIEDLLSLSRLEEDREKRSLSFEKTPLQPSLVSAIEFAHLKAEAKHIKVKLICDEQLTAKINPPLIEQAVLNLIDNAIKYSREDSEIVVTAKKENDKAVITVTDQGCGINEKHLERIFERFYVVDKGRSRKLGGTGLGLAIVKHIANVHGGQVKVESKPGSGSTFSISLPTA